MLLCIYAMCNVGSLLLKQNYSKDTEKCHVAMVHRAPSLTVIIHTSVNEANWTNQTQAQENGHGVQFLEGISTTLMYLYYYKLA